jgi:hypothetical protein
LKAGPALCKFEPLNEILSVASTSAYRIVKLANGAHSVHSLAHAETFHPVVGPVAEAETLYIRQLRLIERLQRHTGEFVIWDVGLGAAANAITFLRAARINPGAKGSFPRTGATAPVPPIHVGERAGSALHQTGTPPQAHLPPSIHLVSFDHTLEPLEFALQHTEFLEYLKGYEPQLGLLISKQHVAFKQSDLAVDWDIHLADFPTLLSQPIAGALPKPHAIMFDAFSPAKNPSMWTQPLFANLFQLLDPARPCALPTYSRSTMLRVTLLLAGFFVGVGHATGEKEETTIAANVLELLEEPLDHRWLQRARRSSCAEPLWEPCYRQAPLSPKTWQSLQQHPQFI